VVETASGVDRDDEECVETQRLTGTQFDVIQFNPIQCFHSYKVHDFFRCHTEMDFDMRQREGTETVGALPWSDFRRCSGIILHHSPFDHFPVSECSQANTVK
jgi:hypothetical protein